MDYFERLKEEEKELEQRISKLSVFINESPKYKELSLNHQNLLCAQLTHMKLYSYCLKLRIEDIEKE